MDVGSELARDAPVAGIGEESLAAALQTIAHPSRLEIGIGTLTAVAMSTYSTNADDKPMNEVPSSPQWYALEVISRKEKVVASVVGEKGYECFLPVYKKEHIWSDRIKLTSAPLFAGYLFARFDARYRLPILVTPGVRQIVSTGRIPAPIREAELEAIRTALQNGFRLEPCDRLEQGDEVLVTRGPLAGIEGTFQRVRGRDRLVLSVSLIERSVSVEIDHLCVEPIRKRRLFAPGHFHTPGTGVIVNS